MYLWALDHVFSAHISWGVGVSDLNVPYYSFPVVVTVILAEFQLCWSNLVAVEHIQFPLLRRIRDQTRLPFIFIDLIVFLLKNFSFQIVLPEREEHQPEPDCPGARGGQRRRPELRRQLQDLQGQSFMSCPPITMFEEKLWHWLLRSQAVLNN